MKGDIGEDPTFLVSSCGDNSAKSARWMSKNCSDSDELDLDNGSVFFLLAYIKMWAEKIIFINLHGVYDTYIIVYGQMRHCGYTCNTLLLFLLPSDNIQHDLQHGSLINPPKEQNLGNKRKSMHQAYLPSVPTFGLSTLFAVFTPSFIILPTPVYIHVSSRRIR